MKTRFTNLFVKSGLAGLVAGAIAIGSTSLAGEQASSATCGLSSLTGTYVFSTHGFNVVAGVMVPKAIVETIQFNGDGTLVAPFATISLNGVIIHNSGATGTYVVNEDCTGTITFTPGPTFDFVIGRDAKQLWMIQTVDPSGAAPVYQGVATKIAR
jgi:hypothetical protein